MNKLLYINHSPDGVILEDDLFKEGYDHVQNMVKFADNKELNLWHGWALREAFWAGALWQKEKNKIQELRKKEGL